MARRKTKKKLTKAEAGRKGGKATVRKYGVEHMRKLGKAGFIGLSKKLGYMGGSRLGAIQWLIRKKKLPGLTPAQHVEYQRTFEELMDQLLPPDVDHLVGPILDSIRSAPTPEWGGL